MSNSHALVAGCCAYSDLFHPALVSNRVLVLKSLHLNCLHACLTGLTLQSGEQRDLHCGGFPGSFQLTTDRRRADGSMGSVCWFSGRRWEPFRA